MTLRNRIRAHARAGVGELLAAGRANRGAGWVQLYEDRLTTFALELILEDYRVPEPKRRKR